MTYLLPTDVRDPDTGGPLYVYYRPHGALWHWYKRVVLCLSICWRRPGPGLSRIALKTAWEVAKIVHSPEDMARDLQIRQWPKVTL
ncbi:MAG: hypothetical protein V1929_02760 [bacterium]